MLFKSMSQFSFFNSYLTFFKVVNQFGNTVACTEMISDLLKTLSILCLHLCQHGLSTLDPDTLQAFIRLLSSVLH